MKNQKVKKGLAIIASLYAFGTIVIVSTAFASEPKTEHTCYRIITQYGTIGLYHCPNGYATWPCEHLTNVKTYMTETTCWTTEPE